MNRQETIIEELLSWINDNLRNPLKIEDVAKRSGYSKWHLQRMFHRIMHVSMGEYIRDKKLELAAHDLVDSRDAIMDISIKYGYESQQSFTRSFVRKYHVPPAKFRRLKNNNFDFIV